jgi:hypothetical protein
MPTINSIGSNIPIEVAKGGSASSSFNINGAVISGATGTSALTALTLTDGQIVVGNTAGAPLAATITAGSGISVTNAANSITIAATGGVSTVEVTGTTQAMAVNTDYIANNAGLVTLTLPATAALGTEISVLYKGAGGWLIAQNAGQTIRFGTSTTTTGVAGSLASFAAGDCVKFKCITADLDFEVFSSQGNITVV